MSVQVVRTGQYIVSTLLEIQHYLLFTDNWDMFVFKFQPFLRFNPPKPDEGGEGVLLLVSTLLEIQRLICLVLVGF